MKNTTSQKKNYYLNEKNYKKVNENTHQYLKMKMKERHKKMKNTRKNTNSTKMQNATLRKKRKVEELYTEKTTTKT